MWACWLDGWQVAGPSEVQRAGHGAGAPDQWTGSLLGGYLQGIQERICRHCYSRARVLCVLYIQRHVYCVGYVL